LKEHFKHAHEDYAYLAQAACKLLDEIRYECIKNHICPNFDRFYIKNPLEIQVNQNDHLLNRPNSILKMEKMLLQLGQVPKIVLPSITLDHQPNLIVDYLRIHSRFFNNQNKLMEKCSLRNDPNIDKLLSKYSDASFLNIVLTKSAFCQLVYHLSMENSDDLKLPFSIHEKTIYFEKPLPSAKMSQREKNEKFYKKSLITTLIKQHTNFTTRSNTVMRTRAQSSSYDPNTSLKNSPQKESTIINESRKLEKSNLNVTDLSSLSKMDTFGLSQNQSKEPTEQEKEKTDLVLNSPESPPLINQKPKRAKRLVSSSSENDDDDLVKKFKSANSSDYESYEEEDENNLIIEDDNQEKQEASTSAPASPQFLFNHPAEPTSPALSTIQEPDNNFNFEMIQPKVIPLEKVETNSSKVNPSSSAQKSETPSKKSDDDSFEANNKPSLFDLISKMQEKLITPAAPSSVPTKQNQSNTSKSKIKFLHF
jgi:hypothetical protein